MINSIIIIVAFLIVFASISYVTKFLVFRELKKDMIKRLEKMNEEEKKEFERRTKEQHKAMEEFRRNRFLR